MKRVLSVCLAIGTGLAGFGLYKANGGFAGTRNVAASKAELEESKARADAMQKAFHMKRGPKLSEAERAEKIKQGIVVLKAEMDKMKIAMGGDKRVANLAEYIILEKMAKAGGAPGSEDMKDACSTQANCPIPLAEFYGTAIRSIPAKQFGNLTTVLQGAMLSSDMPTAEKAAILKTTLTSPDTYQNQTPSQFVDKTQLVRGQDTALVVNTQAQFLNLHPPIKEAFETTAMAIKNSPDQMTKLLLAGNMGIAYPDNAAKLQMAFVKMGALKVPVGK